MLDASSSAWSRWIWIRCAELSQCRFPGNARCGGAGCKHRDALTMAPPLPKGRRAARGPHGNFRAIKDVLMSFLHHFPALHSPSSAHALTPPSREDSKHSTAAVTPFIMDLGISRAGAGGEAEERTFLSSPSTERAHAQGTSKEQLLIPQIWGKTSLNE